MDDNVKSADTAQEAINCYRQVAETLNCSESFFLKNVQLNLQNRPRNDNRLQVCPPEVTQRVIESFISSVINLNCEQFNKVGVAESNLLVFRKISNST